MSLGLMLLLSACEAPSVELEQRPPEILLSYLDLEREWHAIVEDGIVPLYGGPEGGFFAFLGIDVINMHPEDLDLEVVVQHPAFEDPLSRARFKFSAGTMLWPMCPSLGVEVTGVSVSLRLTVVDIDGIGASKSVSVVPACAEQDLEELCRCQCSARFPEC
jgi:hypothetical protein